MTDSIFKQMGSVVATAISTEVSERETAITAETVARTTAISNAINNEITARQTAITNEVNARDAAIAAEAASRTTAIGLETTARTTAIAAEATAREQADQSLQSLVTAKQDALVSGTSIKTINGVSMLGSGNIATSDAVFVVPVASGEINMSAHFTDISWQNTSTNSYGWLVQRKDGVTTGDAQFGLVQGGYRSTSSGGCSATVLPFQISASNVLTVGTPTRLWTNSSYPHDFSTCSLVTDNKSGAFHYSGHIPWPGVSHTMGYGTAILNANNTATHIYQSASDTSQGIHDHNGQYFGLPDSDGSGWLGVNTGYSQADSRTRIHVLDFRNPSSPSISVQNPSADTSTSPVMQFILQANSTTANTAISGCTHWRSSTSQVYARVFAGNSTTYGDYSSGSGDWGLLNSTQFYGVALSNGKVVVYHGNVTYAYTAYNNRTDITSSAGTRPDFASFNGGVDFGGSCIVPDGVDSWLVVNCSSQIPVITKWTINLTTYKWTRNWSSKMIQTEIQTSSYLKLNTLPNNRLMLSYRAGSGFYSYWIINRSSLPT